MLWLVPQAWRGPMPRVEPYAAAVLPGLFIVRRLKLDIHYLSPQPGAPMAAHPVHQPLTLH